MLKTLRIQNLVLIEKAEVSFGPSLNILTGETGAGKSAILSAIGLIAGDRADQQLIRRGASLAVVEAEFASCLIRREIHASGKNRCFINDELVTLESLKKWTGAQIERVDQSSSAALCSLPEQRKRLDSFADLHPLVEELALSFEEELKEAKELSALRQTESERERQLKWAEEDLRLIEETDWKSGEEAKLEQEHRLLTHAQELIEKLGTCSSALSEGSHPIVPLLKRFSSQMESLLRLDPKLKPAAEALLSAGLELEEAARFLTAYLNRLEIDPKQLEWVEARISAIESMKKRFGGSFEEMEKKKIALQLQIETLSHLDEKIENLESALKRRREKNEALSQKISQKRKEAAPCFNERLIAELKSLNLPHAQFSISLEPKPLSSSGSDEVRFLFSANLGNPPIPLEECASGGELSRLLLSIQILLSEKEGSPCLVFDEIDSNVGGKTAAILGEKLKTLSKTRQIICVTHFVQVARCGEDHFLVSKGEKGGETITAISKLVALEKEKEYNRMLGNCL